MNVNVHEAKVVCASGIIELPCHVGRPYGRVDNYKLLQRRGNILRLPSGAVIPWTPAARIGW